ncbi:NB-ARC domain-containing protein [Crossiella cryophila]|uniref:Tetratricopeptide (TPR) repeat protein n=1 Tax=Crossiella cryophila TaxID=43355 RepID=A0A7W7CC51_9PSEU|nr:NB-ARC domain-containing protein [Crossiella cryophila]MBB4678405.1 tetratricopeptide (TPR) repeat protein [Crossiella cryophila]
MGEPRQVPGEVPAGPVPFVGRGPELDELTARAERARVIRVGGTGGVGKSALCRHWSADTGDRFTGGKVYVDLADYRVKGATGVGDAIADVLRRNGVAEEHIPAALSARASLYRTRLSDPVLVVLDNVLDAAEVEPLVPNSAGSLVLVTSERQLAGPSLTGTRPLVVRSLTAAESVRFLGELCGAERIEAEPEAALVLAGYCAGLPLALRLVAARLNHRAHLTIARLNAELADESRRLERLSGPGETVSAVLDNSYRALTGDEARLYRRLGLLPVRDITIELVVAAAEIEREEAAELLAVLVDASLLEEIGADLFRLHDLVRLHAKEKAGTQDDPAESARMLQRLVGYYLAQTAFADRAIMGPNRLRIVDLEQAIAGYPDPFGKDDTDGRAIEWLTAHRANLLAVLRAVAERGWHDKTWQLAELLVPLYFNRRYLDDWVEATELGAVAAEAAGRADAEARLRSVGSRACTDLGLLERAKAELDRALALAEASGHRVLLASVWEFLGRYWDKVDRAEAERAYLRSIQLNAEAGEQRGVGLGQLYLGGTLHALGRIEEALAVLGQALTALDGDARMRGRARMALAAVHAGQGRDELARVEFEAAVEVFTDRKTFHYRAQAQRALADIALRQGDLAVARENLLAVLDYQEQTGGPAVAELRRELAELDG